MNAPKGLVQDDLYISELEVSRLYIGSDLSEEHKRWLLNKNGMMHIDMALNRLGMRIKHD